MFSSEDRLCVSFLLIIKNSLSRVNMKVCGAFVKLKYFVYTKPPLVLFTMSLAILALGTACISMYIKKTDLTVDNASKSWDAFLENLSSLEFCLNSTDTHHDHSPARSPRPKGEIGSFSFPMLLTIQQPFREVVPRDLALLTLVVDPTQLGFKSWPAGGLSNNDSTVQDTTIEIFVPIPPHSNLSNCSGDCSFAQVSIHTCVTIEGPPCALPSSIITPQNCHAQVNSSDKSRHLGKIVAFKKSKNSNRCGSAPMASLNFQRNPAFVVHFSLDDKSLINLHLFYSSFFLFVMIFMILIFALLRGKLPTNDIKPFGGAGNAFPDITNGSVKAGDKELLLDEL